MKTLLATIAGALLASTAAAAENAPTAPEGAIVVQQCYYVPAQGGTWIRRPAPVWAFWRGVGRVAAWPWVPRWQYVPNGPAVTGPQIYWTPQGPGYWRQPQWQPLVIPQQQEKTY